MFAWRSLRRTPTFTVAAIATLALGIGAATAIFSLVNAVLLKPVPYPDPQRLVVLNRVGAGSSQSGQIYHFVRDHVRAFDAVSAQSSAASFNLVTPDAAVHVTGMRVSADFFRAHGVRLLVGREFSTAEDTPRGPDAVIVSAAIWQRLLGGQVEGVGRTIRLGGVAHTVVGVMPGDFRTIPDTDILVPLRTTSRDTGVNYRVLGRLRPDVTLVEAQTEIAAVRADAIRELGLDERNAPRFAWLAYRDVLGRAVRQPLLILLGAVGFLLLIACVNVASLNLARAVTREREMVTLLALGAGRGRVLRHLFGESLIIAGLSGLIGLAVAAGATRLLFAAVSDGVARQLLGGSTAGLDWRVLAAATVLTCATALFFGMAPAAVLWRLDLTASFDGARTTAGRGTNRLRRLLAAGEIALAVVLLIGAGLLVRTFANLTNVDLGFDPSGVVVGRMSLQGTSIEDVATREAIFEQALGRIRGIPGVLSAAAANHVPVESGLNLALVPPAGSLIDRPRAVDWRYVTSDYFDVLRIAVRAGRTFDNSDRRSSQPVAVVNDAFARIYFGRTDVLGETLQFAPALGDAPRQLVGVVADVKARSNSGFGGGLNAMAAVPAPTVFVPAGQAPDAAVKIAHTFFQMTWIVRTDAPPALIEQGMREALRAVDPTLPFVGFEPMSAVVAEDLDLQRLLMVLMAAFATSSMLLAAVGLSGLIAYSAAQRRRELGVRMALGATAASIARTLVAEGLSIAVIGVFVGALGAVFVSRVLRTLLHGVTPFDGVTFVTAAVLLIAVAALASFIPSVAAARTDPVSALRAD